MNKKNGPSLGHNKKSLLKSEVEHIDITSFDSRKIIESMKKMSFVSRETANAANIFNEMTFNPNNFLTTKYISSIRNNIKDIEYENLISEFKINNFVTTFDYLNENNTLRNNSTSYPR